MDKINFGLDLATSASVIIAAISYVVNTKRETVKARNYAFNSFRVKYLTEVINSLMEQFEKSNKTVNDMSRTGNIDLNVLIQQANEIKEYLEFRKIVLVEPWSLDLKKEQQIFDEMQNLIVEWGNGLHQANKENDISLMRPFNTLIIDLSKVLAKLSTSLRAEIEKS